MAAAPLRVAFAGTPEFAACALDAILAAGYDVPLVLTQPDRPAGRGMKLTPSPVKQLALARGIEVDQPEKLRTDEQRSRLVACAPDVLVVAAYGLILPTAVLDLPRLGCINIHASLLPRWRGAAPIHRAIEAGDAETGITIMQMEEGLDTGPMLLAGRLPIGPRDGTPAIHDALAAMGGELILRALAENPAAVPQPEQGVTYAPKLSKADGRLDWTQDAAALDRRVRALNPWPGTFFEHQGETLRVLAAEPVDDAPAAPPGTLLDDAALVACGQGALRLLALQRAGRAALPAEAFLRGHALPAGQRLG